MCIKEDISPPTRYVENGITQIHIVLKSNNSESIKV